MSDFDRFMRFIDELGNFAIGLTLVLLGFLVVWLVPAIPIWLWLLTVTASHAPGFLFTFIWAVILGVILQKMFA